MGMPSALQRWFGNYAVALVVVMVVVVPLVRFDTAEHTVNRSVALQVMGILLCCTVVARADWGPGMGARLLRFLCSGVNTPALLFLGWVVGSALWVVPDGVARAFGASELFRLGTGILVCLVVANYVENRRQLETLLDAVLLIVACATLYRIYVPQVLSNPWPLFGGRLLHGAFLCLLLPVVTAAAAVPLSSRRQIAARVITVLTLVTLLVTPTRSAWFGALAGMSLFGLLAVRHYTDGVQELWARRHQAVYPVAILAGALILVLTISDIPLVLRARAQSVGEAVQRQDSSFEWRLDTWKHALTAIRRHPLVGLGIGNYVLEQHTFSHHGQTKAEVIRNGASMEEQVHNEYLHLAAELGIPGLLLYLGILLAFFAKALHALEQLPVGTTKLLLMGCIAAITSQVVDAVSNPAWRYPVCGLYFWLVLGMGTALIRMAARRSVGVQRFGVQASRHSDGRNGTDASDRSDERARTPERVNATCREGR